MDKIAVASNKKILLDVVDQFYSIFSFEKASLVLGEDFISPKELFFAYGSSYEFNHLKYLYKILPSDETLYWCKENGFMLIPGPVKPMTRLNVYNANKDIFETLVAIRFWDANMNS